MAFRRNAPSPEQWGLMRYEYEDTDRPLDEISAANGISTGTLRDRIRRWNWKRRREPIPREGPPPRFPLSREAGEGGEQQGCEPGEGVALGLHPSPASDLRSFGTLSPLCGERGTRGAFSATGDSSAQAQDAAPPDDTPLTARLRRAVERELAAIERVIARRSSAGDSERGARALATLTRTLRALNDLQSQDTSQDAEPQADDNPDDADALRDALARKIEAFVAGEGGGVRDDAEPEGT